MSRRERQSGTRERIQQVALKLFTEQGYEKTALREIAEQLDVTKAALYYHFKTKEDIIGSIIDDCVVEVSELIEWAQDRPRTLADRKELIRRYAGIMRGRRDLVQFFEANQTVAREVKMAGRMREQMLKMFGLLSEPDWPVADRLRCRVAVFAIHMSMFALRDENIPPEEISAASLEIADELLERSAAGH